MYKCWQTAGSTKESGSKTHKSDKDEAYSPGVMAPCTKVTGRLTKLRDEGDSSMLMVMCMTAIGRMTSPMAQALIIVKMGRPTQVNGKVTSSMGRGKNPGQMDPTLKACISWEENMARA